MGRFVKKAVVVVLVLLVGGAGLLAALAYLPLLAPQRRLAVEQLIAQVVDRPVSISGDVVLVPGSVTSLDVAGLTIGAASGGTGFEQLTVDDASLRFQLLPVLRGDFRIEGLSADGIELTTRPPSDAAEAALPVSAFLLDLSRLLDSAGTRDLQLQNVTITESNDPDGWGARYKLTELVAKAGETAGERTISALGTINHKPVKIEATFAAAAETADGDRGRKFKITTSLPGYESEASGTLEQSGSELEATFTADISSLGDMLELFLLKRAFDGTAKLSMSLSGPSDALVAKPIKAEGRLSTGERLTIEGEIADFSNGTGVDVTFAADLRRSDGSAPQPSSAFDIELERITGGATGDILALTLANLVFATNLTEAELARIGPVSVERVTRDKDGRLALRGLHILSGDPKNPSLDLKGDVLDVLNRSGIELAGAFDVDALELATGKPAPASIGKLAGTLAIDDSPGALQLRKLSAKLTGQGPVELALEKPGSAAGTTSTPVDVKVAVTDLAALAEAFGAEAATGGSLSFEGRVALEDELTVRGDGAIGQSPLTVDLRQDIADGKSVFRGKVGSSALQLADLRSLGALSAIGETFDDGGEQAAADDPSAPPSWLDAELDVQATVVAEKNGDQADVAAHLVYGDGRAALDPFQLDYAGGSLQASTVIELGSGPPAVSLDGRAQQLELAQLLGKLGATPLIDAPLGAQLKLDGSGLEIAELASTVDGTVALTLGAGKVATSLIDLAGESIVSWLFSSRSGAELVCAEGQLTLKAGRGTVDRIVIETTNVQLIGTGTLDLGQDRIDVSFAPRPLHERLIEVVTPFKVHGKLTAPQISTGSTVGLAGRAVVEALSLPINALSALVGFGSKGDRTPCSTNP